MNQNATGVLKLWIHRIAYELDIDISGHSLVPIVFGLQLFDGKAPAPDNTLPSSASHVIALSTGWNMISLPLIVSNTTVDGIFGSNVTTVYGWTGTSYTLLTGSNTLTLTKGYWMLANSATTVRI